MGRTSDQTAYADVRWEKIKTGNEEPTYLRSETAMQYSRCCIGEANVLMQYNDQADKASSGAASTVAFEAPLFALCHVEECGFHGDKFNAGTLAKWRFTAWSLRKIENV